MTPWNSGGGGKEMSRLVRNKAVKDLKMPEFKVLGTITDVTAEKIKDLVINGNNSVVPDIVNSLNDIIGAPIRDISADLYDEPVDHRMAVSRNYEDTKSVFFLNVSRFVDPEMFIDEKRYNLLVNKIVFVNHRYPHRLVQNKKIDMILLSGVFDWNTEIHGD